MTNLDKNMINLIEKTDILLRSLSKYMASKQSDVLITAEDLLSVAYYAIWKKRYAIINSGSQKQSIIQNAKNAMIDELRKSSRLKSLINSNTKKYEDICEDI